MDNAQDLRKYKWREVTPAGESYLVHHWYTILGHSTAAGTLDMLVRWGNDGGHCTLHRHVATTTVFVIEGEQHLYDCACRHFAQGSRLPSSLQAACFDRNRTRTMNPPRHCERSEAISCSRQRLCMYHEIAASLRSSQ